MPNKEKETTKNKVKALRGMTDILPEELNAWRYLETVTHGFFPHYGYKEIRLPLLEETRLFARSIGIDTEIVQKEMYTVEEKSSRSISLRPEATASVVRAFLEHNLYRINGVKKYYYLGPMFRRERPQAGRLRQFHQVGVELIGSGDLALLDADVIETAHNFLVELGIEKFEIQLNHLGCRVCRKVYIERLKEYFKRYFKALCPDCQRRFNTNPLRLLDCKKEGCRILIKKAPKVSDSLCGKCKHHFQEVQGFLSFLKIDFRLNPHLVRGLDYYTGIIFEIIHPELGTQNALGAGGRYDNLIEEFGGPALPATGFSFGLERIIAVLPKEKIPDLEETKITLVVLGKGNRVKALEIKQKLRKERYDIAVETDLQRSLKSILRQADKLGSKFVLILGDDEGAKESVQVKNMASGKQELVKIDRLAEYLGEKNV